MSPSFFFSRSIILSSILTSMLFSTRSHAASYSAFCWAQTPSGVACSEIVNSPSYALQSFFCKQYALAQHATASGFYRYTNPDALFLKQEEGCTTVNTKPKWDCFLEERCESGGVVTSSISPVHRSVFSDLGDSEAAKKACVTRAASNYLDALGSIGPDCLMGARAVLTMPK